MALYVRISHNFTLNNSPDDTLLGNCAKIYQHKIKARVPSAHPSQYNPINPPLWICWSSVGTTSSSVLILSIISQICTHHKNKADHLFW